MFHSLLNIITSVNKFSTSSIVMLVDCYFKSILLYELDMFMLLLALFQWCRVHLLMSVKMILCSGGIFRQRWCKSWNTWRMRHYLFWGVWFFVFLLIWPWVSNINSYIGVPVPSWYYDSFSLRCFLDFPGLYAPQCNIERTMKYFKHISSIPGDATDMLGLETLAHEQTDQPQVLVQSSY